MDDKPLDTDPGEADVTPAEGEKDVSDDVTTIAEVLSETLGREFKDDKSAIDYVKKNNSYVGIVGKFGDILKAKAKELGGDDKLAEALQKLGAEHQPEKSQSIPSMGDFVSKKEFDEAMWYEKNPEFAPYKTVISAAQKADGFSSPAEALEKSEALKTMIEKARKYDVVEKSKSVLHSNPRLGQAADKISKARQSLEKGEINTAKNEAVAGVIEAFEL